MKTFGQILDQYGYGFLSDVDTFLKELSNNEIAVDEFIKSLEDERQARQKAFLVEKAEAEEWSEAFQKKAPGCQVCGKKLLLEPINNTPKRMVDDHSKSWWVCPDQECTFDPIMSDKTPFKILSGLGVPLPKTAQAQVRQPQTKKRARSAARRRCGEKRG